MEKRMIVAGFIMAVVFQIALWGTLIYVALHFTQKWW